MKVLALSGDVATSFSDAKAPKAETTSDPHIPSRSASKGDDLPAAPLIDRPIATHISSSHIARCTYISQDGTRFCCLLDLARTGTCQAGGASNISLDISRNVIPFDSSTQKVQTPPKPPSTRI